MTCAAGYCRVSTDKTDQLNSFASQQAYFTSYIQNRPGWSLYKIYADEGVTGTSTKKRTAFNEMLQDARKGAFDILITKEVSRFSRNILDTVRYTRELKAMGVAVIFLNDSINTMDADAELRLCIMGSVAQEESRRTSQRVKWGQTRQMERGVVFGHSLLGYRLQNGRLSVEPKGAETVRRIFIQYGVYKKSPAQIAAQLQREGIPKTNGRSDWSAAYILKILKNEKYVGDLVQKKTYTPDYLTHQKKRNPGIEERIFIPNHHEPIVSRSLWQAVQNELQSGGSCRYAFSGKIRCAACGTAFSARKRYGKNGTTSVRWSCYSAVRYGSAGCTVGVNLSDDAARAMFYTALSRLPLHAEQFLKAFSGFIADVLQLEEEKRSALCSILFSVFSGEVSSAAFCRTLLKSITVHQDKTAVLLFQNLPVQWRFQIV